MSPSPTDNEDGVPPPNYVANIVGPNEQQHLARLVEDALDWAHCFGLVLRTKEHKDRSDVCQAAPFALFPSPFPRRLFNEALSVQKSMNELYFRVSWDYEFLVAAHRDVIPWDAFTRNMLDILSDIHKAGITQPITLLTQRADYMCHVNDQQHFELKQIEVNNIAVSMGGLSQRATNLHRRMLAKVGLDSSQMVVPDNRPIETLAHGIHMAWQKFGDPDAVLLAVVGDVNQNQFDQRFVEYELEHLSAGRMRIERLTLTQCADRLHLNDKDSSLRLDGRSAVAVVYFRTGYAPEDYPTQREWDARRTIERSIAIKCPWIGLQLANTKKVQQVLDLPGSVERFFKEASDAPTVDAIRQTFAGMWGLERDDEKTRTIIQDAIDHPERYVLKPQLEGGGGNYFGPEIVSKLRSFTPEERAAHILMQKIRPLVVQNFLIRAFEEPRQLRNVVSELGIYGCLLGDGRDLSVQHNRAHGHILRTKAEHVNEGGVAVGASVIDTPYLF